MIITYRKHSKPNKIQHVFSLVVFMMVLSMMSIVVSSLPLLSKTRALPDFIPLNFKSSYHLDNVVHSKPIYFELALSPNETYQGFSISILCDGGNGCSNTYTSLNVSLDPYLLLDGKSMWPYNESTIYPGLTITQFSNPPFKSGVTYYIAYASSSDIPSASVACQSFPSNPRQLMMNSKETLVSIKRKNQKNLFDFSVFVPIAHNNQVDELTEHYKSQEKAFTLFKSSLSHVANGDFSFVRKNIHPKHYSSDHLKLKHTDFCRSFEYKVYEDHSPWRNIWSKKETAPQSTEYLKKFFLENQDKMHLIFDSSNHKDFCSLIQDVPFGIFNYRANFSDKKSVTLFVTISVDGVVEYVHYPLVITPTNDTLFSKFSDFTHRVLSNISNYLLH
ncbi:hypothetical protein NAEGRDRAFT_81204 [Naegleria gruberi]|uniref:Uncharacterized protein n=1 Tax=Naegleria gruberi TaxID=5762 RepID=D2VTW6_NAEGR|nr:uncharacterized protein NAEGRDRAFT_81204 [Naegleria gruberi]EFC39728.1 hypothetical protein NAEGRDRAFT_81204 [Naegleria gruberi]|eukprot:XP_002672472.1 hypothetical protein NAEGRDRAFT_81204 [Naegleria gruberi strain NEG-M]